MFRSYMWTIFRLSISYTNVWGMWVATQMPHTLV